MHKCTFQKTDHSWTVECSGLLFCLPFPLLRVSCCVLKSQCLPAVAAWSCHHQKALLFLSRARLDRWGQDAALKAAQRQGILEDHLDLLSAYGVPHRPGLELRGGALERGGSASWPRPGCTWARGIRDSPPSLALHCRRRLGRGLQAGPIPPSDPQGRWTQGTPVPLNLS